MKINQPGALALKACKLSMRFIQDMHAYTTYFHGMREGIYLEMGALDGALHIHECFDDSMLGSGSRPRVLLALRFKSCSGAERTRSIT